MNQFSNILNKQYEKRRNSIEENTHPIINDTLQSFVDDIPFEFNQKYRTIIVSDIDIPDYDRNKLRDILSKSIDFTLENKVLLEALEDLKRKKQQIQSDNLSSSLNIQSSNILSVKPPTDTSTPVNNVLPPTSFRLPSVRDIYWPSINQSINNDLAPNFDGRLTSDDPFHDSANTIRR